mmetsp:Transcript_21783/g.26649  ORF Transcript_21783/g.26649 Transcript_21783/m.26649 type:complete len:637 (-) Transcript_21783:429-2339(-)
MEESKPLLLLQSSIDGDVDGSRNSSSGSIGSSHKSDNINVSSSSSSSSSISNLVKLGYSFGHAQNDLCGAMYFSYLLVFLEGIGLSPSDAGKVLIVGQLVDGMCTPIVGYISDRWDGLHFFNHNHSHDDHDGKKISTTCKYEGLVGREDHFWGLVGRRKTWYVGGLFLVTSTFWMLFTPIPIDETTSDDELSSSSSSSSFIMGLLSHHRVICYAIANSLFQAGWASVQVAHMAMVPEMTSILSERCFLNSIRYAVTIATSITIYILVYLFSASDNDNDHTSTTTSSQQQHQDLLLKLQKISYIVLLAGALMGIAFVVMVNETSQKNKKKNNNAGSKITSTTTSSSADKTTHKVDTNNNDDVAIVGYGSDGGDQMNISTHSNSIRSCDRDRGQTTQPPQPKSLGDWLLRTPGFAGVTANYALSRLCGNVIQLYLPFFVLQSMPWDTSAVATVPLMAYVGMIASSVVAPRVSTMVKDAAWLCLGATLIIAIGSALLLFGFDSSSSNNNIISNNTTNTYVVFLSSTILGFGCAQLMVTGQTQVGELVGNDTNGGIVFGLASLCDKFSTGVVIYFVQRFVESISSSSSLSGDNINDSNNNNVVSLGGMYQYTAAGGPIICAVLACLSLWTVPISIRDRRH